MATLYRKYRPNNFKEVVNQNHVKLTLEHQIQSGNIAHAYLFCGPRAVGKTTLARVFAKSINCTTRKDDESEPCGKCDACKSITGLNNLDVIEIDAASHTGVDNVRDSIIASARVTPSTAKYKVFVIDEVHMMSVQAFNALLKIIEEPPAYVIFILCTTEVHKVPTTIISRCQRFDFKRLSVSDLVKKLEYIIRKEKIEVEKSVLESIARQSEGYMRDAESMLGQIVAIGGKEITQKEADLVIPRSNLIEVLNLLNALAKKDAAVGIRLINTLLDEGYELKQFTKDFIEIMRKILLTKINPALGNKLGIELGENLEIEANKISSNLSTLQLVSFIDKFIEARNALKDSFITQLPLELAVVEICEGHSDKSNDIKKNSVPPAPLTANPERPTVKPNTQEQKPNMDKSTVVASGTAGEININAIALKWHEVLAKVKSHNHSLSFILRVCEPRGINGNQLCLAFKYKFHKERVGELEIKNLIERTLNDVFGQQLLIDAIVDENLDVSSNPIMAQESNVNKATQVNSQEPPMPEAPPAPKETGKDSGNNDMVNNLLKNFGGKVIK